jgi:hypothetical protein
MASLEIPNIPESLYREMEKLARVRGTTLAEVATSILARGIGPDDAYEKQLTAEIAKEREEMAGRGVWVTNEDIQEAKNWGRK